MNQTDRIGQLVQKLWQVHTKASFGASPVTSQLRWARLDVTGLAPLPKLVVNPLSRGGHTQIAGFGAFSKNGGTHTVPLCGAHVKNLNSHLKSLRNKRKERQKEQR